MSGGLDAQCLRNDTSKISEDTIAARFERQVSKFPNRLALVTDELSLTYRELDLKASRIAGALACAPFRRDQPVALFMKDEAARIAAILGVLKASRIFMPLARSSPEKWVAQVIEDSGAAQIIVDSSTRPTAERAARNGVTVTDVEELVHSSAPFVSNGIASAHDTALIVYTSGSTGHPKGVATDHRSLIRRGDVRYPLFGLGHSDRYANLRSDGVASGITNAFLPLLCGGCLFPFELRHHGLQKLALWLITQKITYISFSASLLRTWLASLPDDLRFPALRFVGATGESFYAQDVIRLSRHLEGDWRIAHSYSSTESGLIAAQVFTSSRLPDAGVVAVGHPVNGVGVVIENEAGAPVEPDETGEIVVRGRFVGQGYWNNPELTAKVFQTDPLDRSIRIYRTGDRGRWRSDGTLEHRGRKGRRIRLRGYNVEPLEVEYELMRQPGVTDAVVLLHEGGRGQEPSLVGYVVAPADASTSAIRRSLNECLPSYMVPSHIVVLDSFPTTRSGKIDRNALPPPLVDERHLVEFRAPSNDYERELLAIWQGVLNVPRIGIDDDFFELGGTSLQALMVFAQIETRLGCSFSPTTLVLAPTIARLAELMRISAGTVASQTLVPLRTSGTGLPLFLVYGRFYFAMHYRHLVSDLKGGRPIFGLQPPPLDGKHRVARTIEAMAADCVTEIRRVQPHGPYLLAGHSFGGRLSFEIAQRLVLEGERVSFLGLIDTVYHDMPVDPVPQAVKAAHLFFRLYTFFGKLRWIRNALLVRYHDLRLRQGRAVPVEHRLNYHDRLCRLANRNYVPKPYSGDITMFSSAGNSERQRAHWAPLARGKLVIYEVPAGHFDMAMPPHSKILAEQFDICLVAVAK